jgi:hypothetical protein
MNINPLFLALAAGCALGAAPVRAVGPDMPAAPAPAAPSSAGLMIPSVTFPVSRYEALWTKSPFAVATSEETVQASPDYMLVGIANVDGIFYASVIEQQPPQEHFLISSDGPTRGMILKSISKSADGQDTYASVLKDGQPLTLKLQQSPAGAIAPTALGVNPTMNLPPPPGFIPQQIQMPGASTFPNTGGVRPFPRMHRPQINLPPRTQQQQIAPPPPPAPGTTQMAPPPPH